MITREEIENIALLSKLSVSEDEMDFLVHDMQEIIDFADTINGAMQTDLEFDDIDNLSNAFRQDVVIGSYDREDILKNASDTQKDHFLVRKRA